MLHVKRVSLFDMFYLVTLLDKPGATVVAGEGFHPQVDSLDVSPQVLLVIFVAVGTGSLGFTRQAGRGAPWGKTSTLTWNTSL